MRRLLDRLRPHFEPGGRLDRLGPLFEATDTFFYTPGRVSRTASHVRDGLDLKRLMTIVVLALVPSALWGMYDMGWQACHAIAQGAEPLPGWRTSLFTWMGFSFDAGSVLACSVLGALHLVPALVVCYAAGGAVEVGAAMVRRHEVNEGFFVTGFLIPLTLPPTIPLWQVALGTAVGVLLVKEVFGGTGMNFLNPALAVRALLFFAYPAQLSGTAPWIAADFVDVDTFTGATWLARAASAPDVLGTASFGDAFFGLIPGSMGETSTLCCLLGATLLLATRVASWRTMAGVTIGTAAMATALNLVGSDTNPMFAVPFWWHMVLGGWAFGTVFMATDPVTSAFTDRGRWICGIGIGALCVLVRVANPGYPEGMMLAILFWNMYAPLVDHFVVRANIRRRRARHAV